MDNERAGEAQGIAPRKHSTSLEDEGCSEIEDCYHETAAGLCTTIPFPRTDRHRLSLAGGQPFALLPASTFARIRASTQDHAGSQPAPPPRTRFPVPAGFHEEGGVGPVRSNPPSNVGVRMAAEPARAQPGTFASARSPVRSTARGSAQAAARREAGSSRGDGERGRARHHEGKMVGGRARARGRRTHPGGPVRVALHLGEDQVSRFVLAGPRTRHPGRSPARRSLAAAKMLGGRPSAGRRNRAALPAGPRAERSSGRSDEGERRGSGRGERWAGGTAGPADPRPAAGDGSPRPAAPSPDAAATAARCSQEPRRQPHAAAASPPSFWVPCELRASRLLRIPPRAATANTILLLFSRALSIPPSTPRPPRFPPLARRPVNS